MGALVGGIVGIATYAANAKVSGQEFDVGEAVVAAGVGALTGGFIGSGIGMLSAGTVGGISAISGAAIVSEVAGVTISTGAGIGRGDMREAFL